VRAHQQRVSSPNAGTGPALTLIVGVAFAQANHTVGVPCGLYSLSSCPEAHWLWPASAPEFLDGWNAEYARFEDQSTADHREFSMAAVMAAFLARLLHREPAPAETAAMVGAYSREWNTGVRYPPGIAALIDVLAHRFRLAIVSNTHEAAVVRDHLDAMGISHQFAAVVTSVEVGYRKPHPAIYAAALGQPKASRLSPSTALSGTMCQQRGGCVRSASYRRNSAWGREPDRASSFGLRRARLRRARAGVTWRSLS
jgi:Haloacid dehalogenase-like hydrolase